MDSFAHPTTGAEVGEWGDVSFSRSITNHRQAGGGRDPDRIGADHSGQRQGEAAAG